MWERVHVCVCIRVCAKVQYGRPQILVDYKKPLPFLLSFLSMSLLVLNGGGNTHSLQEGSCPAHLLQVLSIQPRAETFMLLLALQIRQANPTSKSDKRPCLNALALGGQKPLVADHMSCWSPQVLGRTHLAPPSGRGGEGTRAGLILAPGSSCSSSCYPYSHHHRQVSTLGGTQRRAQMVGSTWNMLAP